MTALRTALSAPATTVQRTSQLALSMSTLGSQQQALTDVVNQIHSSPPQVGKELQPLMSRYVVPLMSAVGTELASLHNLANEIRSFCDMVQKFAASAHAMSTQPALRRQDLELYVCGLHGGALSTASACVNASNQLTIARDHASAAASSLNTMRSKLEQEDAALSSKSRALEQRLNDMAHEAWYDKIVEAFKAAFGNLQAELRADVANIRMAELEMHINQAAIAEIDKVVAGVGNIASTTSALEVSWRSVGDSLGSLAQDLDTLAANTTPSEFDADLAYVNSDWQAVLQALGPV